MREERGGLRIKRSKQRNKEAKEGDVDWNLLDLILMPLGTKKKKMLLPSFVSETYQSIKPNLLSSLGEGILGRAQI